MRKSSSDYKGYTRSIVLGALTGIVMAVMFVAGFLFRDIVRLPAGVGLPSVLASSADAADDPSYPLLDEVQTLIDDHYLREQPDYMQRQYAAVRGMLGALNDPYTFFIDPPVAQSESDVLAGTYGGIGVQIQRSESGQLVLYPFPDGPAAREGVIDGDALLAIDGAGVDIALQPDAVDQMLRGEVREGNGVTLTLMRTGEDEAFDLFVPFEVINVPSVVWRMLAEDDRIGYVQIMRFTSRTPEELATALNELKDSNAAALVVDLRNNSGGLLQESVVVADEFLDGGVVLYEESLNDEQTFDANPGGLAIDLPLAILVNQGTASAAELVAGALQDYERGILVGQRTYGKGTVQQIFRLSDESSIHITSAEWFTPDRHALDGTGLTPTIEMIPDQNGRDVELGEATRYLQELLLAIENGAGTEAETE